MIPISDDNTLRKSTPIATYALIALNILFFLLELANGEQFILNWAFNPSRFLASPGTEFPTIFSAMFMHAGWAHLIGNMLYLWIFGDNVEDRLGKIPYVLFYIICGVSATFAQLWMDPSSNVPNLGASGAIGGILGAYLWMFPKGMVNVLFGRSVTQMSALIVIGFWFVLQFMGTFGALASAGEGEGGVAYMAHVGGFVTGLALAAIFSHRAQ